MGACAIRLLGGLEVTGPDGAPIALSTRKAGLLLARLALAGTDGTTRAHLASLLWSERAEKQARASVRQALFALRKELGSAAGALVARGDRVALSAVGFWVDAREAEHLARTGRDEELLALRELYRGPLLDGHEGVDAAFDGWLDRERDRLHRLVISALSGLLRAQVASGDAAGSERTAERIVELDRSCEEAHRALMRALAARGDRAGALRMFEALRAHLYDDLGVEPEPETARVAAELRRPFSGDERGGSRRVEASTKVAEVARADGRERRHVAVVHLCDGATGLDDEAKHARRTELLEHARAAAGRHRGVLRSAGSSDVAIVLGAPIAYGDEARRAVLLALELCARFPDARVGVAAGDVIADVEPEPLVTGGPIERAASLAARARAGKPLAAPSLASEAAARLVLRTTPVDDDAVEIDGADARDALTPFTGRVAESAQLEALVAAARAEGRGRVVVIRGEAGIGKSRLAKRFAELAAARGFEAHFAYVLDFGGESRRDALRAMVRSVLGLGAESGEAELTRTLSRCGPALADPLDEVFLCDLIEAQLDARRKGLLDATATELRMAGLRRVSRAVVRDACTRAPRVLVVEDLHWADRQIASDLAELAQVVAEAPAIVVITTRVEGETALAAFSARAHGLSRTTIDLGPLSAAEVAEIGRALGASEDAIARCRERAGGHPLLLEELLRFGAGHAGAVPASVRSLVQARLDGLPSAQRGVLQAASVLGQRFSPEALAHLAGVDARDEAAWAQHGMLRRDGDALMFSHALLCEGVYETLLVRRRRELHRRAAEWLEPRDLLLAAEHYERAEDPRAASAFGRAAEALLRSYRATDGLRAVERGRALARTESDVVALAVLAGEVALELGDTGRAVAAFDHALLHAGDDAAARARALIGRAGVRRITDELPAAFADVEEARTVARAADLPAELARASFLHGNLLFPGGDVAGCLAAHETSLSLARQIGRRDLEAAALGGIGDASYLAGRMRRASETLSACVSLARELGLGRVEVANLVQQAVAASFILPLREVVGLLDSARAAAARVGAIRPQVNAAVCVAWASFYAGDYDAVAREAAEADALMDRLGSVRFQQLTLALRGATACLTGDRERGLSLLERSRALGEASAPGFHAAETYGHIARFAPDETSRRRAISRGAEIVRGRCVGHAPLRFYPLAARAALELGDRALARTMLDELDAFTRDEPLPHTDFHLALFRAALGACEGTLSGEALDAAVDDLQRRGRSLDSALADEVAALVSWSCRAFPSSKASG